MALFDPCMEFEIFLDQMTSFEVIENSPYLVKFILEVPLAPHCFIPNDTGRSLFCKHGIMKQL